MNIIVIRVLRLETHYSEYRVMKQNAKKGKTVDNHSHNSKEIANSVVTCIVCEYYIQQCGYVHGDVISTFAASNY